MKFLLKKDFTYRQVLVKYTLLTLLSALGCSLLGYVFMPFAAAFYAAILTFENTGKRILSYVLPIIIFLINFSLRGIYSLEAIAYLIVGLSLYFCIKRNKTKGETAFWLGFSIFICLVVSFLLLVLELSVYAGYESPISYFSYTYESIRTYFLDTVTSLVHEDGNGIQIFVYNLYEAEMFFRELVIYVISVAFLLSFVLSGITLKIFCHTVEKNAEENAEMSLWFFKTSNIVAYFFIALSIIALMADSDGSAFSYVIFALNTLFTAVFAYIGIKSIYYFIISRGKSRAFAIVLIVIIFALLSSFSFQLLSYLGVIVNIVTNKVAKNKLGGN